VERFASEDQWWKTDVRGVRDLSAVNELLANCGLGKLRSRDDVSPEFKRRRDAAKKENDKYESRTSPSDVADDAEDVESYLPASGENAWAWADNLATRVDTNPSDIRPWYSALLSYVHKFPNTAKASDLDAGTVRKLVEQICSN
jgi:hypothetical protein